MSLIVKTVGRDKQYDAQGIYSENEFIVKKGSKIAELKATAQVPQYVSNRRNCIRRLFFYKRIACSVICYREYF